MSRYAIGVAAGLSCGLLYATAVHACGYCVEDKMAAVYDHAVVTKAVQHKHRIAFFALEGPLARDKSELARNIQRTVESVKGVVSRSSRVSVENAALSFAFDPKATALGTLERAVADRLAGKGLSSSLVTVMDRPQSVGAVRAPR